MIRKSAIILAGLLSVMALGACAPGAPGVTDVGFSPNKTWDNDYYATNTYIYPARNPDGSQHRGYYEVLARDFTNGSPLWCYSDLVSAAELNVRWLRAEPGHEYYCDTPEALRARFPGKFGE